MAAEGARRTIQLTERSSTYSREEEALSKWVVFSFLVHGLFIAGLFIAPFLPSRSAPSYPIYTVDLVGGEKIGGPKLGAELTPTPHQPKAEKAQPEPSAPITETKKETKREKTKQVEKVPAPPEKTLPKEVVKKEPVKKEAVKETRSESKEIKSDAKPTKSEAKTERGLSEETREKLIQAALDRVKDRTTGQKSGTAKGEAISTGPGEGDGAAAIGSGGRGGGIVKGPEFIMYYNKMLTTIRENWTWPGQRADLKTTVHFGIRENGEIVGLRIVQASGDPSYDDSVVRAVRKSSPLASPPETYRRDFADVKLTFRPEDLGGSGR